MGNIVTEPGLAAALAAGFLSFLSPCVLPLVPAYLSYISGTSAAARTGSGKGIRLRVLLSSLFFSAGFTVAFIALGILFSGAALFVGQGGYPAFLGVAGGLLIVALGLNMIFDFLAFLNSDTRLLGKLAAWNRNRSYAGAFVLGLAFAAGWSPCIGPILASILIFAAREGAAPRAAALLGMYSLGFAAPFVAAALFFDALKPALDFFKRRGREVRIGSGILLVLFGALMAAGSLGEVSAFAARSGEALRGFARNHGGLSHAIDVALIVLSALPAAAGLRRGSPASPGSRAARLAWIALAAGLAMLEVAGIVSLTDLAGSWLGYTGI